MCSDSHTSSQTPQARSAELFIQGHVIEASGCLSEAIRHDEFADLWNDWAVVQLSLAERAFRRALQLQPGHPDSSANLGFLLFIMGKQQEAALLLKQALVYATGPARLHILALLSVSTAPVALSPNTGNSTGHDALFRRFHHVLDEYFEKGNRSPEIVTPPGFQPIVDAMLAWIENTLTGGSVHDEDYLVFGSFQNPEATILDVGAHFGYSASSIWSAGAAVGIISFEVNPVFEPCFQRIALLRPRRYDYWLGGLSDSSGSLNFAMPTINGHGIGALTTACTSPGIDGIAANLTDFFKKYLSDQVLDSFLIHSFQSPVARLDDLLGNHRFSVPTDKIVAVKIDTEGLEGQVLAGSRALLASQEPLILAEAGHCNSLVCKELLPLGYLYARRTGRQLETTTAPVNSVNGFFLHPIHSAEYRRIGLLKS